MANAWLTNFRAMVHGILAEASIALPERCFRTKGTPFSEHQAPGLAVATPRRSATVAGDDEFTCAFDLEITLAAAASDEEAVAAVLGSMERKVFATLFGSVAFMSSIERVTGFDSVFGVDANVSPMIGEQLLTLHLRTTEAPLELVAEPEDALLTANINIDLADPVDANGGPLGDDGIVEAVTEVTVAGPEE